MPGANRHGSPEKKAVNQHLWLHHRVKGTGDLLDRLAQHDLLHAESSEYPYAGKPKHRHENATAEDVGEVVLHEGEGT